MALSAGSMSALSELALLNLIYSLTRVNSDLPWNLGQNIWGPYLGVSSLKNEN